MTFYERALSTTWSPVSETGVEGSPIGLGTITETAVGVTPLSLVISAIPPSAMLSDGTHSFTAAGENTSVDVTGWNYRP